MEFKDKNRIYSGCLKGRIKLAAFDLDGTLLTSDGELTDSTVLSLNKLRQAGVRPVISTGRLYAGARIFSEKLGLDAPQIVMNGALIRDERKIRFQKVLDNSYCLKAARFCAAEKIYFHMYIDEYLIASSREFGAAYYENVNLGLLEKDRIRIIYPGDMVRYIRESRGSNFKIMIMSDNPSKLELAAAKLKSDDVTITSSWHNNIEIFSKEASKGRALRFLCDYYSIDLSDTIAFGDNINDLDMIETSGFSVAMGNAVPELKKAADYITAGHDEDGIALAVSHLFSL